MVEPRGRILDDLARLVTDAAGVAQGVRREAETVVRAQLDRLISSMDLVSREEFEAVRDMAARAREENEALKKRIDVLEAKSVGPAAGVGGSADLNRG
jgi:BMFP domain-containing protein YqiC